MWAEREEGSDAELLEERVSLGVASAHEDDHLVVQLERAGLKLDSAGAWRDRARVRTLFRLKRRQKRATYLCQRGSRNLREGGVFRESVCVSVSSRGYEGARTNVDNVAFAVDHDVAVVAVLYLEYIARYGVRCHRLDEVLPCFLIRVGVLSAIFRDEEALEVVDLRAAHFVSRS